jgi:hypothetical protein
MLERIATIITAIGFLGGLAIGLILNITDLIATAISGTPITGIDTKYTLGLLLFGPPIFLLLIYLGAQLDKVFNLKQK